MKKYISYCLATLLLTAAIMAGIVLGIICFPQNVFYTGYQSLIQDKYRILCETNEPKIIIVSGSSSAFGLNQSMLEEASGYKVANLGLHAGFLPLFYTELSKENINPGDIVLLGYEYDWKNDPVFDYVGTDLIMSGIDNHIEMYLNVPIRKWPNFLGYIFEFAAVKNSYVPVGGIYSREAFDAVTGQMTMKRDETFEAYYQNPELHGFIDLGDAKISQYAIDYLSEYKEYVESCGATVYFVAPPVLIDSIICEHSEFDRLKEMEMEYIGIPYISNPTDYFFTADYMYNSIYHCNSAGEIRRTELLIADLQRAGVIN